MLQLQLPFLLQLLLTHFCYLLLLKLLSSNEASSVTGPRKGHVKSLLMYLWGGMWCYFMCHILLFLLA